MIFLAITPTGLAQALRAATENDAIWSGSDAISEADYAARQWPNLSRFAYSLEDRVLIDDAVSPLRNTTRGIRSGSRHLPCDSGFSGHHLEGFN